VVAGLEEPRAGSIHLDGRDLAGVPAHERGVGLMFQDYALFPHRDVGQNVAFGMRMQGAPAEDVRARVHELLTLVGLPGAERRPVEQLSGGEQQRVALARALAPGPRLLMLDEPMGSLDGSLRERLPEELRAIFTRLGLTTIYVTHDQDEALSVADRLILAGGWSRTGRPSSSGWRRRPHWVARFLGFRNVAPGRWAGGRLETPWGSSRPRRSPSRAADDFAGEVTVSPSPARLVAAGEGPHPGTGHWPPLGGDHVLYTVAIEGAPALLVEARGGEWPAVGQAITLQPWPGRASSPAGTTHATDRGPRPTRSRPAGVTLQAQDDMTVDRVPAVGARPRWCCPTTAARSSTWLTAGSMGRAVLLSQGLHAGLHDGGLRVPR
jgi:thiamine transport system ATP-binding protein